MDEDVTLATLLRDHPEWADLPLVVLGKMGVYEYIDGSASAYTDFDEDENIDVLVFTGN